MAEFHIHGSPDEGFHWRLVTDKKEPLAASRRPYVLKAHCLRGIEIARHGKARVTLYHDAAGRWHWKLVAPNGRTIAHSVDPCTSKEECVEAADRAGKAAVIAVLHDRSTGTRMRQAPRDPDRRFP